MALNPGQLPARRGSHGEQGVRLRRAEEIETLSHRTVVELNAKSRLALQRRVATITRHERAQRLARSGPAAPTRRHVERAARSQRPSQQQRGWWPTPDRPTLPERTSDHGEARLRADLTAYLGSPFSMNSPG